MHVSTETRLQSRFAFGRCSKCCAPLCNCSQAAANGRIVAREGLKAVRKNVLAKCYGGDVSRKRKLLEKQKEGKKKLKRLGNIEVPQEVFPELMKTTGR